MSNRKNMEKDVNIAKENIKELYNLLDAIQVEYGEKYPVQYGIGGLRWEQPKLPVTEVIQMILDHLGLEISEKPSTHKLRKKENFVEEVM